MKVTPTALPEVLLIEPRLFEDERGFFYESFNAKRFAEHGLPTEWPQDNHSRSVRGVLRGLHYQLHHPQGKLVTVVRGEVFDVAVDIRRGSPTFGAWTSVTLSESRPRYLWIPPGFAHGYCTVSPTADFLYKCTALYDAADDRGVIWSDARIGITWPDVGAPLLSPKDQRYAGLDETRDDLPTYAR